MTLHHSRRRGAFVPKSENTGKHRETPFCLWARLAVGGDFRTCFRFFCTEFLLGVHLGEKVKKVRFLFSGNTTESCDVISDPYNTIFDFIKKEKRTRLAIPLEIMFCFFEKSSVKATKKGPLVVEANEQKRATHSAVTHEATIKHDTQTFPLSQFAAINITQGVASDRCHSFTYIPHPKDFSKRPESSTFPDDLRVWVVTYPALENTRSDCACDAGKARRRRARQARLPWQLKSDGVKPPPIQRVAVDDLAALLLFHRQTASRPIHRDFSASFRTCSAGSDCAAVTVKSAVDCAWEAARKLRRKLFASGRGRYSRPRCAWR